MVMIAMHIVVTDVPVASSFCDELLASDDALLSRHTECKVSAPMRPSPHSCRCRRCGVALSHVRCGSRDTLRASCL